MSRAEELFGTGTKEVNKDGFPAHKVSLKENYVQMVMTNTIGDTYYMNQKELLNQSMDLHREMLNFSPSFMAKTAIYGRNNSMMRLQPIIATVFLSTKQNKKYFVTAFNEVIKTPGDLVDFITVLRTIRTGRGLGRAVKRQINNYLNKMDQYRALKYGGGNGKNKWTLKDIIRACHPIPENDTQGMIFDYLTNGTLYKPLDQVLSLEALKRLDPTAPEYTLQVTTLIERGKLPYEIVTGIVQPNMEIWEYLMRQMPIFALVRNLNTLDRAGIFTNKENIDYVISKLTNVEIIRNSRILPFRFVTAMDNFTGPIQLSKALEKALDISLDNMKMIPGDTAWFLDESGSMSGDFVKIGAILGIAGLKKSENSMFFGFGNELKYPRVDTHKSVMDGYRAVMDVFGGGTSIDVTINYLLGKGSERVDRGFWSGGGYHSGFPISLKKTTPTKVDNIVIITDEQQNSGKPVIKKFREYRKTVNKDAKLFIIDISPYSSRIANDREPGVTFIYGWSDSVLDVLQYSIEGNSKHVDIIDSIELK